MKGFLLCAGKGTRLGDLTRSCPKCLLPVKGEPLLMRWLRHLGEAGVSEVLINLHHHPERLRESLAQHQEPPRVLFSEEPELLGSAGTLAANVSFVAGQRFWVIYSDNYTDLDLRGVERFHDGHGLPMTVVLFHAPRPEACGIVSLDDHSIITRFEEKPRCPSSDLACGGIFLCESEILNVVPAQRPCDIGKDLMPRLIERAAGFVWDGVLVDIGTPEGYATAQKMA